MIFWILLVIAVIGAVLVVRANWYDEWGMFLFLYIMAAGIVGSSILGIFNAVIPGEWEIQEDRVETNQLSAMELGDTTYEGRRYLYSGYFSGSPQVQYIREDESGALVVRSVSTDNSYIFQDEEENPYMVIQPQDENKPWLFPWRVEWGETYEFHVPDGSVITGDYSADLQDVR